MSVSDADRAALVKALTGHFDRTQGISAEDAREIAEVVIGVGWAPDRRAQGYLLASAIADRLGVSLATVVGWYSRYADTDDPFPAPDSPDGARPLWLARRWPEIKAWHKRHLERSSTARSFTYPGYVTQSGLGVWIGQPGWWVRQVRMGELEVPVPFPSSDKEVPRGEKMLPLWSAERRPEIVDWYASVSSEIKREKRSRR